MLAGTDASISSLRWDSALILVASWSASVRWLGSRLCTITVRTKPRIGGEALLRLEPSSFTCHPQTLSSMLFLCHTSCENWLLFQLVTPGPFPEACMAARKLPTRWACATVMANPAPAVPCSTSTPGPWFGPSITRLPSQLINKHSGFSFLTLCSWNYCNFCLWPVGSSLFP